MNYYYNYERQYGFPGFPSGGTPNYPGGEIAQINRRLDRMENQLQRHTERLNRLNRRLQRVERQLGYTQGQW